MKFFEVINIANELFMAKQLKNAATFFKKIYQTDKTVQHRQKPFQTDKT